MALPTTGPISLGQVRTELNKTGSVSLGSTDVRNLAGKTSGTIKMSDLYGKSYIKNVDVILLERVVSKNGTIFNINYNIYKCQMIVKNKGEASVYCNVDGVYSGEVKQSRIITIDLPQGYGRSVRLNSMVNMGQYVIVQLIGQVYS